MGIYKHEDMKRRYEAMAGSAVAWCRLTRELVGGQPADRTGLTLFVKHHLKLEDPAEIEQAVNRILQDEIGERDVTPEAGEVKEKLTYGVNVIRRHPEYGPWVGDWMVKACLKAALSRTGVFKSKIGSKGDVAEMGVVEAVGPSLCREPYQIFLWTGDVVLNGEAPTANSIAPAPTFFQRFKGRVDTPQGAKSIVNDSECVEPGAWFSFRFSWYDKRLTESDIVDAFAAAENIGLGSAKAMERGKFHVERLEVTVAKR